MSGSMTIAAKIVADRRMPQMGVCITVQYQLLDTDQHGRHDCDGCRAAGLDVAIVAGEERNLKLTFAEDSPASPVDLGRNAADGYTAWQWL